MNKLAEFVRIELVRRRIAVRRLPTRYTLRSHFAHAPRALMDLVEVPLVPNERDGAVRKLSDLRSALSDREIDAKFRALISRINVLAEIPRRQSETFAELREQWREIDDLVKKRTLDRFLDLKEKPLPRTESKQEARAEKDQARVQPGSESAVHTA